MKSSKHVYRVDRRQIHFLKFIFEAYDGLASITTVDPELGVVSLSIPEGCEADAAVLMKELQRDIYMEPYQGDAAETGDED